MGPKFGIIVIEVKSTGFSHRKSFTAEHPYLPNEYMHGIRQLRSVDTLRDLLQECLEDRRLEKVTWRKILFTPNFQRCRYVAWLETLKEESRFNVQKQLENTIQWFREDLVNDPQDSKKPALYSTMMRMLASEGIQNMDNDVYETYAPVLVGLTSVVLFPSKHSFFELDRLKISESQAILRESSIIESQNPMLGRPRKTMDDPPMVKLSSKVVLLTPDQQRALNGPQRQFIVGAAGTGKTIVLQAKALELLERHEYRSVLVLAPESYCRKYKELFEKSDSRRFDVRSWSVTARKIWHSCELEVPNRFDWMNQVELRKLIEDSLSRAHFGDLCLYDHVFIDDALDWNPGFGNAKAAAFVCLLIFALAERDRPGMTVWAALDPICHDYGENRLSDHGAASVIRNFTESSLVVLNSVLRCPEFVFQTAYDSERLRWPEFARPRCGHKIGGAHVSIVRKETQIKTGKGICAGKGWHAWRRVDAVDWTVDTVIREVTALSNDGVDRQDIAVIISTSGCPIGELADRLRDRVTNRLQDSEKPTKRPKSEQSVEQSLAIRAWHEVSSLEWPIVIYASVRESGANYRTATDYERYRAASRTTGKFTEIVAKVGEDKAHVSRCKSEPVLANMRRSTKNVFS